MGYIYFPAARRCRYFSLFSLLPLSPPSPKMMAFVKLERGRGQRTSVDRILCNYNVKIETVFTFVTFLFKDTD